MLDAQTAVSDWVSNVKKEFTFSNSVAYSKYRINITENCGNTALLLITEMEMMGTEPPAPSAPTNLSAIPGDSQVDLTWNEVTDDTSYNIKRATVAGGPYETVASSVYASYSDIGLTNDITYYYVVSAVNSGGESENSTEVSATPQASTPPATGNGTLVITMENGADKEYNLTMTQINAFISWYNNRSTGGNIYTIEKPASGAYTNIKDYLVFDKIVAWEVKEY